MIKHKNFGNYIAVSTKLLLYSHVNIQKFDQKTKRNRQIIWRFQFFVVPLQADEENMK